MPQLQLPLRRCLPISSPHLAAAIHSSPSFRFGGQDRGNPQVCRGQVGSHSPLENTLKQIFRGRILRHRRFTGPRLS
jgi:hypothetical protein